MHRCYSPGAALTRGSSLTLEGEEAHHALRVMRLREGDVCELFNGEGAAARARILSVAGGCLVLGDCEPLPALPPVAGLTLALAIPKGSNMDLIVQKAVEMGAARIIPLLTERTIVRLDAKEGRAKAQKWRRTALEACKQCGVNTLPLVEEPQRYAAFLQRHDLPALKLNAAIVPHARPLRAVLEEARAHGQRETLVLIGPEGDFSPAEYAAAEAAGYIPTSLGSIILRVETAVFMCLAAARYALDPESC